MLVGHHALPPYAFAGGGGFGRALNKAATIKSEVPKKKKKRGLINDQLSPPKTVASITSPPPIVLDKWGLRPPTIEDIFPFLPVDAELIAANKEYYSLTEIQQAVMHDFLPLDLSRRFDEHGVEKQNAYNRRSNHPMKLRLLHYSPPVLTIENFFTEQECHEIQNLATNNNNNNTLLGAAPVVQVPSAKVSPFAQSVRTSTSWFCHYASVPMLLSKAQHMLGIPLSNMEEPQIVRYQPGQEFSWHYDQVPKSPLLLSNGGGGQRLATLLVYLNTVPINAGGGTVFRDLRGHHSSNDTTTAAIPNQSLTVQPVRGSALLFFPAFANGTPDDRTLHKSNIMLTSDDSTVTEKWILQAWIHEHSYTATLPPNNRIHDAVTVMAEQQSSKHLGYVE